MTQSGYAHAGKAAGIPWRGLHGTNPGNNAPGPVAGVWAPAANLSIETLF